MRAETFLVVSKTGLIRVAKRRPSIKTNEVAISLAIEIPDRLFDRPQLQARVTIPESEIRPNQFSAESIAHLEQVIRDETELNITINVVEPTENAQVRR